MTHEQFEAKMRELGALINVPEAYYPWVGRCNYDGVYVEIDEPVPIYRWVCMERGHEIESRIFSESRDLLYVVFKCITSEMSVRYVVRNKKPNQDTRRLAFEHQLVLLGKIDEDFRRKRGIEMKEILAKVPYRE